MEFVFVFILILVAIEAVQAWAVVLSLGTIVAGLVIAEAIHKKK